MSSREWWTGCTVWRRTYSSVLGGRRPVLVMLWTARLSTMGVASLPSTSYRRSTPLSRRRRRTSWLRRTSTTTHRMLLGLQLSFRPSAMRHQLVSLACRYSVRHHRQRRRPSSPVHQCCPRTIPPSWCTPPARLGAQVETLAQQRARALIHQCQLHLHPHRIHPRTS